MHRSVFLLVYLSSTLSSSLSTCSSAFLSVRQSVSPWYTVLRVTVSVPPSDELSVSVYFSVHFHDLLSARLFCSSSLFTFSVSSSSHPSDDCPYQRFRRARTRRPVKVPTRGRPGRFQRPPKKKARDNRRYPPSVSNFGSPEPAEQPGEPFIFLRLILYATLRCARRIRSSRRCPLELIVRNYSYEWNPCQDAA